jgi:hypothetical protein
MVDINGKQEIKKKKSKYPYSDYVKCVDDIALVQHSKDD